MLLSRWGANKSRQTTAANMFIADRGLLEKGVWHTTLTTTLRVAVVCATQTHPSLQIFPHGHRMGSGYFGKLEASPGERSMLREGQSQVDRLQIEALNGRKRY